MTTGSSDLLKVLGSGVRPYQIAGEGSRTRGTDASDVASFDSLLTKARSGAVSTNRPVTVASDSGLAFSEAQIKRLEQAADVAEASGATKALVLMDGLAIKLDVGVRTVTEASTFTDATVLTGFDALVRVPEQGGASVQKTLPVPAGMGNASLLKALSQDRDSDE